MWLPNCQMSIFRSIHLQHWYPNVNIQIDPFATLVPKLPNVNIQIDPFATLVPKLPNVNIQIDPFATLVPKCQYSDRIHSQSGWLGPQSEYNHLAGAAIRTHSHNCKDRNYDLNAHPHIISIICVAQATLRTSRYCAQCCRVHHPCACRPRSLLICAHALQLSMLRCLSFDWI